MSRVHHLLGAIVVCALTSCAVSAPGATAPNVAAPVAAAATDGFTPLAVGAAAPDFSAPAWLAGQPTTFALAQARSRGPVVMYFFPAAFTPGCNIEARLFSQAIDQFQAKGATVVGVTAGNTDQLAAFSKDNETCAGKFAVAADPGAVIAKRYGAAMSLKPDWSSRTSFLIGKDGRILAAYSASKPADHVTQMLAALQ